jgi:hypothetical protein
MYGADGGHKKLSTMVFSKLHGSPQQGQFTGNKYEECINIRIL